MIKLTNKQLAEFENKEWLGEDEWKRHKKAYDDCMAFRKTIKGKPTPEQMVYIENNALNIEYYERLLYHTYRRPCGCSWCAKRKLLAKAEAEQKRIDNEAAKQKRLAEEAKRFRKLPLDPANRMFRIGFGKNEGRWFVRIDLWWAGFRLTGPVRPKTA